MKLSLSCLLLASSLCAATAAHADTITSAVVYTGTPNYNDADNVANQTANHANFTIGGTGINYSATSTTSPNTIANFLNNPTFSSVAGTFNATGSPTSLEIIIKGSLNLTNGEVLSLTHDDGASLFLNGVEVITSTGPTVAKTDLYTVTGATGSYNFTLNYAANNLEPSVLNFKAGGVNVGATPEPSSLILLGTGLASAAGVARRRFARKA